MAAPALAHLMVPITCGILVGLFWLQNRGTGERRDDLRTHHAALVRHPRGARHLAPLVQHPTRARGRQPRGTVRFFFVNHWRRLPRARLGLPRGHGRRGAVRRHGPLRRRPIRLAWFVVVLARSAAQLLRPGSAAAARTPPRSRTPSTRWPPAGRSTRWSLSPRRPRSSRPRRSSPAPSPWRMQAVQLGFLPRMRIQHTSPQRGGADLRPQQ